MRFSDKIISKQAIKLACLGIVAGLLTIFVLSHFIIPAALRTLTETNSGITVVQQPIIYLGAAIFSLIMVFLSVRKPIQIAKKVSPVTALHYQSEIGKSKSQLKSRHFSAWRMALRNIQRTKKKNILAVLSIFLGITSCLIVTLLIQRNLLPKHIFRHLELMSLPQTKKWCFLIYMNFAISRAKSL